MTSQPDDGASQKFVPAILPWLIAAGALAVYLLTLNSWVSLDSLGQVAAVSGWTWQPDLYGPLYWLVTYPFRWLPLRAIPLALNLFSAVCAVLTLALLARSVALLPHDRTQEQREKEPNEFALLSVRSAWLPPLLAGIVCGLQLTFWEHATAASREMLDLLLFAYVIRCLLEFRLDEQPSWLTRAAFLYGAAMTNNWAMAGFFPVFLAALIWIKRLSFFNVRFLTSMFLWGLAGLVLYLLLPLVHSHGDFVPVPFWAALKANLVMQKTALFTLFKSYRQVLALLSLFSLLPIFIISIRWASYFGDTSRIGTALATFMFHVVHGLFLIGCIWVALGPPFSPRHTVLGLAPPMGYGIPFLTAYYLGALTVGYCSGYFLLVFGRKPKPGRYTPRLLRLINSLVICAVWLLLFLTPVALVSRDLLQLRMTNGPMLRQFAALAAEGLPPRAIVLSDDPRRMIVLQSALAQARKDKDYLFLDTGSLRWPAYHRYLRKKDPQRWPDNPPKERKEPFDDPSLIQLLLGLVQSNRLVYLHPSFGYYFEFFYPEAHGLVYELHPYPTNSIMAPKPEATELDENQAFWAKADQAALKPLIAAVAPPGRPADPGLMDLFVQKAHLTREANRDAQALAPMYSRSLVYWGVELQKSGQFAEAAPHFRRALELNPENVVAHINLRCNTNLQAGLEIPAELPKTVEDAFGAYRNWGQILNENGPFDDPAFCYQQGLVFVRGGLYREAMQEFDRAKTLASHKLNSRLWLDSRLWLAQMYVMTQRPDEALKIVGEVHGQPKNLGLGRTNQTALLFVETSAQLARRDVPGAEAAVQAALAHSPGDEDLLATASQVYLNYGHFSNALTTIEQQLKLAPDNPSALINKGYVCLQLSFYEPAIAALTRVLELQTNNPSALFNRAIAYLRSDQLDKAQRDYETLQRIVPPNAFQIYYGLGEIAYRKKDTNAAVRNYQLYLANAQTNTAEAKLVSERLKELKPHSP